MDRRHAVMAMTGAVAILSPGCESESKPDSTATLFNREGVHNAMQGLVTALETLESDVDGFQTTNWREVVPEVESAVIDLRSAVEELQKELGYS